MPEQPLFFGTTKEGTAVHKFILSNKNGLAAELTDYGATLVSCKTPDRHGNSGEITLGFDSIQGYQGASGKNPYMGATIGRFANRIAGARFKLQGREYRLFANHGKHHLHGGKTGFDKVIWQAEQINTTDGPGVRFFYKSRDGEEGYPGELQLFVTYILTEDNALMLEYKAYTDKTTPINLTNHTYWNLLDPGRSSVFGHEFMLHGDYYLPATQEMIPKGEIKAVKGTGFDLTRWKSLEREYDHCFVVNGKEQSLKPVASVREKHSGRRMDLFSTKPAVQFYTSNSLRDVTGRWGIRYQPHTAFCLETQYFPDYVNQPTFPSWLLEPGQVYHHTTVYRFSVEA